MKNYKQILEAINRGIQLALDDYEDNEPNSSLSQHSDVIDSEDVVKTYINFWDHNVDLGLPSGTIWCKYNLGANNDTNYGDYYAWGEIVPNKTNYAWSNYKWANILHTQLTKYCIDATYGDKNFVDNCNFLI